MRQWYVVLIRPARVLLKGANDKQILRYKYFKGSDYSAYAEAKILGRFSSNRAAGVPSGSTVWPLVWDNVRGQHVHLTSPPTNSKAVVMRVAIGFPTSSERLSWLSTLH
jgi:hypothetical protein